MSDDNIKPNYKLPKKLSRHDAKNASKLLRMLINQTLSSSPSQQLMDHLVKKTEEEKRLYGDMGELE